MKITTAVSGMRNNEMMLRKHALSDLVGSYTFTQTVFYAITGLQPDESQTAVFDALLVASIDHGANPATGFVPRVAAASGTSTTQALAAGLLTIGDNHGGAVEKAMQLLSTLAEQSDSQISEFITTERSAHHRLPGYGHRVYTTVDPRSEQLLQLAQRHGIAGKYTTVAQKIADELELVMGRRLVLNIDGMMAALLLELGFPSESGNGVFALARIGGMLAHVTEERQSSHGIYRLTDDEVTFSE